MKTVPLPVDCERKFYVVHTRPASFLRFLMTQLEPRQGGFVVHTLNLHHWAGCRKHHHVYEKYISADAIVPDGWPIVRALSKISRERVFQIPGVELAEMLLMHALPSHRLFLLGAREQVVRTASERIKRIYAYKGIIQFYHGYFSDNNEPLQRIIDFQPHILLVGMGFPKQELWVAQYRSDMKFGVALCVGGTIDYFAGNRKRSPQFIQKLRMEWLYRSFQSPRQYFKRYWLEGIPAFFTLEREVNQFRKKV